MRMLIPATVAAALFALLAPAAGQIPEAPAQPPQAGCGTLMGGSANVRAEGRASGRAGDLGCLIPLSGPNSVLANGRPTLRVGDRVQCPDGRIGVIADDASSVVINGRPAATAGSRVVGCEPLAAK